jgi:hypothetical protein
VPGLVFRKISPVSLRSSPASYSERHPVSAALYAFSGALRPSPATASATRRVLPDVGRVVVATLARQLSRAPHSELRELRQVPIVPILARQPKRAPRDIHEANYSVTFKLRSSLVPNGKRHHHAPVVSDRISRRCDPRPPATANATRIVEFLANYRVWLRPRPPAAASATGLGAVADRSTQTAAILAR